MELRMIVTKRLKYSEVEAYIDLLFLSFLYHTTFALTCQAHWIPKESEA